MTKLSFRLIKNQLFQFYVLMPLSMLTVVGVMFLPFGFSQVGLIEEWGILATFIENGPLYFITKYTPMAHTRMRPLNMFPQSVAYYLDPNSFFYWHLLQFLSIWLKGMAMGFILWWLYPQRWVAILGGALMMLYPADTMQLALRSLHINSAVASALCGVTLLLWATQANKLWVRSVLACSGSVLFLCACLIYETAFFLAPMPFLLWWAKYGLKEGWRTLQTQKLVAVFWCAAMLIELGYIFWIGREPDLYQSHLSNTLGSTLKIIWQNSPILLTVGFYRTFLHSWYDAFRMLLAAGDWIVFLPIAIVPILLLVFGLNLKKSEPGHKFSQLTPGLLARWLVASLLIAALGYAPYLTLGSHILITQRTYLFAGIGGALLCTALIAAFQERFRWLGAGMAGLLLTLGINAQWTQFEHYKAISDRQKIFLSGILEAAPRLTSNQKILIIDRTGNLESTWMLRGQLMNSTLTYLYGKKTEAIICMHPGLVLSTFSVNVLGCPGRCEEQQGAWQIGQGFPGAFSLPKADLLTLVVEQDGRIHPHATNAKSPPATSSEQARWEKILGCWPARACRAENRSLSLPDHFTFDFGQWWSMEKPTPGVGWQDSQWMVPAWKPRSFAWMNQPQSTLLFHLFPRSEPYIMKLGLAKIISESVKQGLKVFLNGHPLQHRWLDEMHARAEINPTYLKEGVNELLFLTDVDPAVGVSLGVEYVKIFPRKGKKL